MTGQELDTHIIDPAKEVEGVYVKATKEEIYKLRQQMTEMHQAWAEGQPTPVYPANPAYIPHLAQSQEFPPASSSSPSPFYQQSFGTTSYLPQAPSPKRNPSPPITPVFVAPPPATLQISPNEILFQAHDSQYYPPEPTLKGVEPYSYTPHLELPTETEKPLKNPEQEEMIRKVKSLKQSFRNMKGLGGQVSAAYKDMCLFPEVQLPAGFKIPKFDLSDGHGDPVAHLRGFCSKMRGAGGKDELLMAYFSQSLSCSALEWYTRQDHGKWYTWDDLAQAFACHFQYNLEIVPDRLSLTKIEKKPGESFREYGFRWREQASRVDPPMKESEMVDYFLQALEPTYYGHLVSAVGKPFNEVVKMGSMVEEGLKSNKIISYSAIKAITQALQRGTGGVVEKKEDVAVVESRAWARDPSPYYIQPRPQPQTYHRDSHNPPQYYALNNVQSHVPPPGYPLWRAPAPHNASFPSQHFMAPNNPRKQGQGREQRKGNNFTPIGKSYTSLFEKLSHAGLIEPLFGYTPDPHAKSFDPTVRCMYHSNVQGNNIEDCRSLKKDIERMIQEGVIAINDSGREHANPLGTMVTEVDDIGFDNGLGNINAELSG